MSNFVGDDRNALCFLGNVFYQVLADVNMGVFVIGR